MLAIQHHNAERSAGRLYYIPLLYTYFQSILRLTPLEYSPQARCKKEDYVR